jgi:hypothetical protein
LGSAVKTLFFLERVGIAKGAFRSEKLSDSSRARGVKTGAKNIP